MDKVLEILKENARSTPEEIAKRLGRDVETVERQIEALEADKTILGYKVVLDPEKAEDGLVVAIIEVRLTPQRGSGFDAIAERIYKFPEVQVCYLISGDYDLMVVVEGSSLQEIGNFVSQKLSTLDHVAGTATHFILKKYKDNGVILTQGAQDHRLAVSP